ncbi:ChrR Cupin-like domain protein [compost metagenome]
MRNPPGSHHSPASTQGCTIFVKLWQFRHDDAEQLLVRPGERTLLFDNGHEQVRLEHWQPGSHEIANPRGLELLVLAGSFKEGADTLETLSWLRLPAGMPLRAQVGAEGVRVWLKEGALEQREACESDPV